MSSTTLAFASREAHRAWLSSQAILPAGFHVGTTRFQFVPTEAPKPAAMNVTLIVPDKPTPDFAAVFTRNAFPGAPIVIGRHRLNEPTLGAIVVNNKTSNVRAPDGVATAERFCAGVAGALGLSPSQILPSSTGVIGWRLPIEAMLAAVPAAASSLGTASLLDAAQAIMTTDLYPKVRRAAVGQGSIVGIAKGAGMIEPNMATMLVYLLTDLAVPRGTLRRLLPAAVDPSFNCISIDTDTSTSDTVVLLSSGAVPSPGEAAFADALATVCRDLAEDVVRNGEGVHHVVRVVVRGAPSEPIARALGKAVVNSPLVKCAICGNDPNVGRIIAAIGKYVGVQAPDVSLDNVRIALGGKTIFERGAFHLNPTVETELVAHLKQAELYASAPPANGVFRPTVDFPPHERRVELEIDLNDPKPGSASATVIGADLTHEYVSENADYRS
jgi:glutamate N-acetyltransferase/amino-acid N-acetyltransferase